MDANRPVKRSLYDRVHTALELGLISYSQPYDSISDWRSTVEQIGFEYDIRPDILIGKGQGYARFNEGFPLDVIPYSEGSANELYQQMFKDWGRIRDSVGWVRGC